jgi:hypothetical protein
MGTLKGSTLVETIIASVIFMCVFAISLETVSRLTVRQEGNLALVEAGRRMEECFRDYAGRDNGTYTREYEWGEVRVVLRPYRDYAQLREMVVTADVERKWLELRHVIEQ